MQGREVSEDERGSLVKKPMMLEETGSSPSGRREAGKGRIYVGMEGGSFVEV